MTAPRRDPHSAPRWIPKVVACSVVVVLVGSLGIYFFQAVQAARNAARSAATT